MHEIGCSIKEMFWKISQNSLKNTRSSHPEVVCQKMCLKFCKIHTRYIFAGVSFLTKLQVGNLQPAEAAAGDCVLKIFANFTGKNLCWSLFLMKLEIWGPVTLWKKTPTLVFSCEIFKLFKNIYFEEHLLTSAPKH